MVLKLNFYKSGFEEGGVSAIFLHGAHAASGNFYIDRFAELSDKNSLLLEVYEFAFLAGRVEFSGTSPV